MNPTSPPAPMIDPALLTPEQLAAMPDTALRRALQRIAAEQPHNPVAGFNSAVAAA